MRYLSSLRKVIIFFTLLMIVTGVIYPLIITGFAQGLFPHKANGSLVSYKNKIIGSELIGQYFGDPSFFWGRPSATQPYAYNALQSSGSNLGPSNPELIRLIKDRIATLFDVEEKAPVPIDLVTSSGSGLDPDISPYAAFFQTPRIAGMRNLDRSVVNRLIEEQIIGRDFNLLGEPRINVLQLNIALEQLDKQMHPNDKEHE